MCVGCPATPANLQMAGVRHIYRPPSLVAVAPTVSRKSAYHRMNRRYPAKRHRFFRWYAVFQLTVGATATRLGGLYIRLTPAI